jgi:hypothetical protein
MLAFQSVWTLALLAAQPAAATAPPPAAAPASQTITVAIMPAQYFSADAESAQRVTEGIRQDFTSKGFNVLPQDQVMTAWNALGLRNGVHYPDRTAIELGRRVNADLVVYPRLLALGLPINTAPDTSGLQPPGAAAQPNPAPPADVAAQPAAGAAQPAIATPGDVGQVEQKGVGQFEGKVLKLQPAAAAQPAAAQPAAPGQPTAQPAGAPMAAGPMPTLQPAAVVHLRVVNVKRDRAIYFNQVAAEYTTTQPLAVAASLPAPAGQQASTEVLVGFFERVAGSREVLGPEPAPQPKPKPKPRRGR